jgi:putative transposase
LYYRLVEEKPENVKMMTLMDKHLIRHPGEGVVSMVYYLKERGYPIGPKRIRRLFKLMGRGDNLSPKKPDQSRIT